MSEFVRAALELPFLRHALLGGLLAALACGVMGPFVVVRRLGYIAGGISHTVLAGMGVAIFAGASPILGALVAALAAAAIIGLVSLRARRYEDTLISALWSTGMAVGVVFIYQTPGYNTNLMSFLFGNILMVSPLGLAWIAALDGVIVVMVAALYKQLVAISFDEEFARLRGIPVEALYLLLLGMVALTVVILIQVVGLILVIALLTMPAAIARQYMVTLGGMIGVSVALGALGTTAGLGAAYGLNWPAGATIILLVAGAFLVSASLRHAYRVFALRRGRA